MAENCPLDCPNILECEARIEAIADRDIELLRQQGVVEAVVAAGHESANGTFTSEGTIFYYDSAEPDPVVHNLNKELANDIKANSDRLVRAQRAAPAVHASAEACQTGRVPSLLGNLALLRARAMRRGQQLSPTERMAELRKDPRYMKCGNKASNAALRNVPRPY